MVHDLLERQFKKNTVPPVYLWYGEEEFLIRRELTRLEGWLEQREDLSAKITVDAADTPLAEVLTQARSPQLWGGRQLIIVWQAERYKSDELAALEKYLQAPARQTILLLMAPGLKHKDVQAHQVWRQLLEQEAALGFPRLREGDLPGWLQQEAKRQGKMLAPGAARQIVEAAGQNLLELDQELEKLILFTGAEITITAAHSAKLSSHSRSHTIFELVEALGQSKPDKALKVLARLLELGEHPSKIVVMLARQIRLLMRTREGLKKNLHGRELAKELGVAEFIAKKLIEQARGFRLARLRSQLIRLHEADQQIKTGMAVPRLLLEKVILDLCPLPALRRQPRES
jgi:DNA polymerase III subunit delta